MARGDIKTDQTGQVKVFDEDCFYEQVLEPMPFEESVKALLKITSELADAELQSKLFTGELIGRLSRPDYMLDVLYESDIRELIEVHGDRLTAEQKSVAKRLVEVTEFYEEPLGSEPGAWKESALLTLADPAWHSIQNAARDFVKAFTLQMK